MKTADRFQVFKARIALVSLDESGMSTVEYAIGTIAAAAFGVAILVAVLMLCLAGIAAVSMQVRCVDAAREAARLAARGDERSAVAAARGVAPGGAVVQLHRDGGFVVATVVARSSLLPVLHITATGVSAIEPP